MKIEIRNIGPLRRAELEIADLTMLVGRNNTGKSIAMTVLYAALSQASLTGFDHYLMAQRHLRSQDLHDEATSQQIMDLAQMKSKPDFDELPIPLRDAMEPLTLSVLTNYGGALVDELERLTGAASKRLRRHGTERGAQVKVACTTPGWSITAALAASGPKVRVSPPEPAQVWDTLSTARWLALRRRIGRPTRSRRPLVQDLVRAYLAACFRAFPRHVYYLPAARSGIMQIYRPLVGHLVRRTSPGDADEDPVVMTGIVTDFLSEMVDFTPGAGAFAEEAARMERDILHGAVELRGDEDGPRQTVYASAAGDFPLHSVSSMVQELAPVVLYLRHMLEPSDLLLIEEPEAHLHPQAQTALARALVRLVNAGLRVGLTTHSEFLMYQINNEIAAHGVAEEDATRLGIDSMLDPQRVGAFLFRPTEDGTQVNPMPVTAEDGISEDAFADVTEQLYHDSVLRERAARR